MAAPNNGIADAASLSMNALNRLVSAIGLLTAKRPGLSARASR
jgi:hypothetical protein